MIDWFVKYAPIRRKMAFIFGIVTGAMLFAVLCAALLPTKLGLPLGLVLTLGIGVFGFACREGVTRPYVTTVVRMEALADGDLDSPIEFTEYRDCVGRMTQAMFTFRATAQAQVASAREQAEVVDAFSRQLTRLAAGDLTAEVIGDFHGEYARLREDFNGAVVQLRDLVGSVQARASAIHGGSVEIAQVSEDLARRTEANASDIEHTSTALQEMEQRLRNGASASGQTLEQADGVIRLVGEGRTVATSTVQAMERAAECTQGIDSVIEGVDKIAFQTRVLAMNAAVEAGRAGESGRGFAVVADLVSALAMRAEEEARNARAQLSVTQIEVGEAVQGMRSVDTALSDIVESVSKVHSLLSQLAEDNLEQSAAITRITHAVSSMDKSTQQNAAMVEQTSAAARNLDSEVSRLSGDAARFAIA